MVQGSIKRSGFSYFLQGFSLITTKGVKRFVIVPLLINLLIFAGAFYHLYLTLDQWVTAIADYLPDGWDWITAFIGPLLLFFFLLFYSLAFTTIANWIAAPFNGLLSERVEAKLTGKELPPQSMWLLLKEVPRTLAREFVKLSYYLPRAIVFFLVYWFVPVIGQICWFLFLAWMMAVQYIDYPFDNHKIGFNQMKVALRERKVLSFGFGIGSAIFAMVPILNLVVVPVSICGATALWVDHHRDNFAE